MTPGHAFHDDQQGLFFVSSRSIKEVASLGGAVEGLVPGIVARRLKEKFKLPIPKENHMGWEY